MNRFFLRAGLPLFAVCLMSLSVTAQEVKNKDDKDQDKKPAATVAAPKASAEEAALRASSRAFEAAFNKKDAKAIAQLWTEDGDFHDDDGHVYRGRKAIEELYAKFFAESKQPQMKIAVDSIKVLSDSAAIEDGRAIVEPTLGAPGISKYTVVHVKQNGQWLMSSVRDTRIETPSTYNNLKDFEWLIGKWVAEENGVKTEYTCRWIANKSFIERKYVVTHADKTKTDGFQIIGWNPLEGAVQSWNFGSDGGHAIGLWQPHEEGWAAKIQGVTGSGTPTSAFNIFTKLDDNTCTWQSTRRTVGDKVLPDTEEVILKRDTSEASK